MKKYYGVKNGRNTGVFATWDECQAQVTGFSGAEFKGFASEQDANDYVYGSESDVYSKPKPMPVNSDVIDLYVDGSFDGETNRYGMGYIALRGDDVTAIYYGNDDNADYATSRNVAGEVGAATAGIKKIYDTYGTQCTVIVHHDYEGIGKWANGGWKTNKALTVEYKSFINDMRCAGLNLMFVHVKGHTGDRYNEFADMLARHGVGLATKKEIALIEQTEGAVMV